MERNIYNVCITVHNRDLAFDAVSSHLHEYAPHIRLRVGYPIPEYNMSVIFIVIELSNDELGAFTGKLGQFSSVSVKSTLIKK
ncbi:MAG TPA: iron-only hydrogenase system regulator [Candidatus Cloacimonadota bacterium]|nr:iron-only hydrogenase system regulator [Candidatus Cloacimonadota bacterium]